MNEAPTEKKKKKSKKQILALAGVGLLVGLYLFALILAFIHNEWATKMLYVAIAATAGVPVIIYLMMMFYRLAHRDDPKPEGEEEPVEKYRGTGIRDAANAVAHMGERSEGTTKEEQ